MNVSVAIEREFERESHRIDQLIWDGMALRAGESVLFCGFANSVEWIRRAAQIDVNVSVVSDDTNAMREFRDLPVTIVRGSTSLLPARDASFDATIAFHYLHEVDPFFHANVVAELARVGKRCVIVEPAPPSDVLGQRIASLYSRVKRELGQFENYHHIDYWRKLLTIAKSDVSCQTFTFLRTPPAQAARDTVTLIIDTMEAEATPQAYIRELRALAARPEAQLLPQARYVIVGTSGGLASLAAGATEFRDRPQEEPRTPPIVKPFVPPGSAPPPVSTLRHAPLASTDYSSAADEPEFPAVVPPVPATATSTDGSAQQVSRIARNAFGLSSPPKPVATIPPLPIEGADDGQDAFGIPDMPTATQPTDIGWAWDPPDKTAEP